MVLHLAKHESNVLAIHCMSGKGRAGSAAICLLTYLGIFDSFDDAARYFGHMRFNDL